MVKYTLCILFIFFSFLMASCQSASDVEFPTDGIQSENTQAEIAEDVFAHDYWDDAELVWSDEFDGTELSLENWKLETGNHGWGNNELQNYLSDGNVRVSDGTLKIIAKREDVEGSRYTSARLNSTKEFRYGKLEIRAKIPDYQGKGIWPALWMLGNDINTVGWPACGEIDIMEYVSYSPNEVHFSIHSTANNHVNGTQVTSGAVPLETIEEEFHTYGVLWTDKYIKFYIDTEDNVQLNFMRPAISNIENWPFSKPFYFLMNIAVGGNWGGLEGVDEGIFPAVMEVDYVRVYQK
jgi:beta-glucanase (GH16 family)